MDIVTFETAKRLKEAGFPQPQRVEDLCWFYHESGSLFCAQQTTFSPAGHPEIFYAPTKAEAAAWFDLNTK